jgi:hypothetical protein
MEGNFLSSRAFFRLRCSCIHTEFLMVVTKTQKSKRCILDLGVFTKTFQNSV